MVDSDPFDIASLSKEHDRGAFDCGNAWLNNYLRQHALPNQELGYGRTYVATSRGSLIVDAFYTLSMSSVVFADLPTDLAKRVPKYPMPVA